MIILPIEMRGRLLFLAIFLACILKPTITGAVHEPGLPEILAFQLEDGRHHTPGLTLAFALPSAFEYGCRRIVFREQRQEQEIRIELLGVALASNYDFCRVIKEPPPIQERIVLPPEPGNYRIVFTNGEQQDTYVLTVSSNSVELVAEEAPTFTTNKETGRLLRVGRDWLWVDFSFLTDESFRKMIAKRDEVLSALVAIGAKPFNPTPGRYLLDGFVRHIPSNPRSDGDVKEEYFFLWEGDWQKLWKVANRFKGDSTVIAGRPVMMLWLSGRDNVVSTRYGSVWTYNFEMAPPAIQDVAPDGRPLLAPTRRSMP